jgi:TolA-binding protein
MSNNTPAVEFLKRRVQLPIWVAGVAGLAFTLFGSAVDDTPTEPVSETVTETVTAAVTETVTENATGPAEDAAASEIAAERDRLEQLKNDLVERRDQLEQRETERREQLEQRDRRLDQRKARLDQRAANLDEREQTIVAEPEPEPESVYYDTCSDAEAAGDTPLYAGDPGYADHLDADGDGVACE